MKAFVVTRSGAGDVQDVAPPAPTDGQVVVDIARAGVCGTDVGIFHSNQRSFPARLGHEWCGRISQIGNGVDQSWLGQRVTGDTMLGCGRCARCQDGRHYICEQRYEIGVRGGWPGAFAEKLLVPATALHRLPDAVTDEMGALVEPGGNAYRAVEASGASPGSRILVLGPGTIGLLCTAFALAAGSEVHVLGLTESSLALARKLGAHGAWTRDQLPDLPWDGVIDATDAAEMPQFALDVVEPGRRVVFIGSAHAPSPIDSRTFMRKAVTAVGILGGSHGLAPTIAAYESGAVNPLPLVATTVGLGDLDDVLARRTPPLSSGTKVLVDPTR
jgi:threonine dehydrogenase-like Zn-dependent dehydrogenase